MIMFDKDATFYKMKCPVCGELVGVYRRATFEDQRAELPGEYTPPTGALHYCQHGECDGRDLPVFAASNISAKHGE